MRKKRNLHKLTYNWVIPATKQQPHSTNHWHSNIIGYIKTKLKLVVNTSKTKVAKLEQCSFLGFAITAKRIRAADTKLTAFKQTTGHLIKCYLMRPCDVNLCQECRWDEKELLILFYIIEV